MSNKQLTHGQRYQIEALLKTGMAQKAIAQKIGVHPSTIGRELKRNTGLRGYRNQQAQRLTDERRKSAHKAGKLTDEVKDWIVQLIEQDLSPQQVVDYLEQHRGIKLHHESVYQFIYEDKRQGGKLHTHLRIANKSCRKRYGKHDRRGQIKNRVSIEERPEIVESKTRIGDWEGDTIIGKGRKSALLTLVERKTLYTIIVPLTGKRADLLADAAIEALKADKQNLLTLTLDNGKEFAEHERMAEELEMQVYFAHPYSSWERGINENTNGLIRQYFPKGMDLSQVTQEQAQWVMDRLNNRPRQIRNGKTPNELFRGQRVELLTA